MRWPASIALLLAAQACLAGPDVETETDPVGDAVFRRTDPGTDGVLLAAAPIDLRSVSWRSWDAPNAATDPYVGSTLEPGYGDLFRLDVQFVGLVNPPGPIGLGGHPFDPGRFGPTPVVGFVELNTDRENDTGGVIGLAAQKRFLANVARFGARPESSEGEIAESADDYDANFFTGPQYERLGSDFTLIMCGCFEPTVSVKGYGGAPDDGDNLFDAGEAWIVSGRFFERSPGYQEASAAFGGSDFGLYDPVVDLLFSHSTVTDRTTVTLVWALTNEGSRRLRGDVALEPNDLDVGNQTSIEEALEDIIVGAEFLTPGTPAFVLAEQRRDGSTEDDLDTSRWRVSALIGTPYATPEASLYAWTDVGFELTPGDCDGDQLAGSLDRQLLIDYVYGDDGQNDDEDGTVNGVVDLIDFGPNFSLYDLNGDGLIRADDLNVLGSPADMDLNGVLNGIDVGLFLSAYSMGSSLADLNLDQVLNGIDVGLFLSAYSAGQ